MTYEKLQCQKEKVITKIPKLKVQINNLVKK